MLTSKAKLSAQVSAARAAALHECSGLTDDWGYVYRACMAQHDQEE
jgi:hypothetical protein